MKKREFLKLTGIVGAGVVVSPFIACGDGSGGQPEPEESGKPGAEPAPAVVSPEFTLPELGFGFTALEPAIDAMTMEIHHGKHHAGYVRKLNKALTDGGTYSGQSIEALCAAANADNAGVRNNGGGHYNHSLYWKAIAPGGGNEPSGQVADAMNAAFGSFEGFAENFSNAAKTRFGSGWAWMNVDGNGKLFISSTPNQDNPLMTNLVEQPGKPILGIDVWEHAYYLNYQNERGRYINSFLNIINWDQVGANFAAVTG